VLVAPLLWTPACAASAPTEPTKRDRLVENAARRFGRAVLYKPREGIGHDVDQTFVPLIVEQADNESAAAKPAPKTLYSAVSSVELGGEQFDQVTFAWTYNGERSDPQSVCGRLRGVRITIDNDGYPLIWEALSDGTDRLPVFVAESLEQEAKTTFGEPQSGARVALEQKPRPAAEAVIVGTVEQGPVPMGPYVYLSSAPQRTITTILCRCSPSQVDEFIATAEYDLQPLKALEHKCPDLLKRLQSSRLETMLRWPRGKP
jgi:hypothetical protein